MPVAVIEHRAAKKMPKAFKLQTADAIVEQVLQTIGEQNPASNAARAVLLKQLKTTLNQARKTTEADLLADHHGTACAQNLSLSEDEIIRAIYMFATRYVFPVDNPSSSETISIAAVGGYGRTTLAPGSDIDLLFVLPYKQTAWGEQVTEYILYMLWDLGQKVGHAVRSVDECLRMAKTDMTVRTATLEARFLVGNNALFETMTQRFEAEIVAGTGQIGRASCRERV